jgi:hypothetical protein
MPLREKEHSHMPILGKPEQEREVKPRIPLSELLGWAALIVGTLHLLVAILHLWVVWFKH